MESDTEDDPFPWSDIVLSLLPGVILFLVLLILLIVICCLHNKPRRKNRQTDDLEQRDLLDQNFIEESEWSDNYTDFTESPYYTNRKELISPIQQQSMKISSLPTLSVTSLPLQPIYEQNQLVKDFAKAPSSSSSGGTDSGWTTSDRGGQLNQNAPFHPASPPDSACVQPMKNLTKNARLREITEPVYDESQLYPHLATETSSQLAAPSRFMYYQPIKVPGRPQSIDVPKLFMEELKMTFQKRSQTAEDSSVPERRVFK